MPFGDGTGPLGKGPGIGRRLRARGNSDAHDSDGCVDTERSSGGGNGGRWGGSASDGPGQGRRGKARGCGRRRGTLRG